MAGLVLQLQSGQFPADLREACAWGLCLVDIPASMLGELILKNIPEKSASCLLLIMKSIKCKFGSEVKKGMYKVVLRE